MADTRLHPILRYLRRTLGGAGGDGTSDAELLRRFVADRDEVAFELLLRRHAAAVWHVCRHVLGAEAAEDAFQATFLVFVHKAASVRRGDGLGGWLYRVAYHTALKARQQAARRRAVEQRLGALDPPGADADPADVERRRVVCEEVSRLPPRYRTPVVACFFEGQTHEEAARQLGWPRGTVASRLVRARELLRRRLLRRGVALSAIAALSGRAADAGPLRLISVTLQAAKSTAPPRVAALTEGVLRAMYWTRIKIVTALVLAAGLGGGVTVWQAHHRAAEPPRREAASTPAGDARRPDGGGDAGQRGPRRGEEKARPREEGSYIRAEAKGKLIRKEGRYHVQVTHPVFRVEVLVALQRGEDKNRELDAHLQALEGQTVIVTGYVDCRRVGEKRDVLVIDLRGVEQVRKP